MLKNKKLFLSGIGAGGFYLLSDLLGGLMTPDYNYIRNAVSELIQSGATLRLWLSPLLFLHAVMIVLFAIVLMKKFPYKKKKAAFIGSVLLLTVGLSHAFSSTAFPMDPVDTPATFPGTIHLVLVGITVVAIFALMPLLAAGLDEAINWKYFKVLTYVCLGIITISGFISPLVIAKGLPIMGLTERVTGYIFYIWLAIIAWKLYRGKEVKE